MAPLLAVIAAWMFTVGLAVNLYQPPQPVGSTDAQQFSAERAFMHLESLVGKGIPHPAGSAENAKIEQLIAAHMTRAGFGVNAQSGVGVVADSVKDRSPDADQVTLSNVVAAKNLAASVDQKKLLVVAHYDSHPAGPGASDNGVAVAAVMEVAALLGDRELNREIVFLFSDGEELGLLGAKHFFESHSLADEIGLVINLDARGTSGSSLMFETGPTTSKLIPILNQAKKPTYASSLFYEIYRRLPRDTDFTVFKSAGIEGYNFAFIGNVRNYHTPADSLENVTMGSLQHHGDNLLYLLEALEGQEADVFFLKEELLTAEVDESSAAEPRVVYFDFMGRYLFWWPESMAIKLALLALIGWVASAGVGLAKAVRLKREGVSKELDPTVAYLTLGGHLFGLFSSTLVVGLVGLILYWILQLAKMDDQLANPWPKNPWPWMLGLWCIGFAMVAAVTIVIERWSNKNRSERNLFAYRTMSISLFLFVALTLLTSQYVVGASYLFLVPSLVGALLATLVAMTGLTKSTWSVGSLAVMFAIGVGAIWLPLEPLFYDAIGLKFSIAVVGRISIVLISVLPLMCLASHRQRFGVSIGLVTLAVGCFLVAKFG